MKKGKMFKKSISCLLAALMIIASMPFSALSASAATSVSQVAQGVRVISGSGRYKTNELTLVNDQLAGNTDIGYVTFDISGVNVATDDVITANYTFNDVIENTENNRESCGLNVYFATQNIDSNFYSNGSTGFSGVTFTQSGDTYPNFISEVEQYYGLKKIASYPKIENLEVKKYSYNRTINLGPAIKEARLDGKDKLVVCFMLANKGGVDGEPWSDELVKITQTGVTVETSKIGELVLSSSAKTYSESYIGDTAKNDEYMKGFYKSGTWNTQNPTTITATNNSSYNVRFTVSGIQNAVAFYDSQNKDIRFPVISHNDGGSATSGNHLVKVQYVALPSTLTSKFSMGDDKWRRCSGTNNLQTNGDNSHDFDSHESASSVTTPRFYTGETKQWRNYIKYIGGSNTDNYYDEMTTFSWNYSASFNGGSATNADIPVTYGVYIVNILPLNQIITDKKSDYSSVFNDNWKYTDDSLARYYIAWQKIVNFDVSSYITTGTGEEAKVAAAAVKDLVNEYNTAYSSLTKKQLTITFRKHDNSTVTKTITAGDKIGTLPANSIVDNGNKQHDIYTWSVNADDCPRVNTEYTETKQSTENHDFRNSDTCACGAKVDVASFEAAAKEASTIHLTSGTTYEGNTKNYYYNVFSQEVDKRNKGEFLCQDDFDKATYEILYAKTLLKKQQGTVTLTVFDENGNVVSDAGDTFTGNYGDTVTVKPKSTCNIVKWVVETNTAKKELVGELPSIDLVVNGGATVKAYCDNSATDTENSYTKVIFKGSNGKVSAIKYVKVGDKLKTDTVEKPSLALYTIGDWNVPEVVGSADTAEVTVIAPCEPNTSYQCGIHFVGLGDKVINKPYDTRIDINDYIQNDNVTYALATDDKGQNIIAYIDGTVFYVPARAEVFVVKSVDTKETMINTVGVYTTTRGTGENAKKTIGFNCKFSLAEGCKALEWGVVFIPIYNKAGGGTKIGTSTVAPIRSLSAQNEYTARINIPATSTSYNSIKAKAYLKYRDEAGNEQIKYGNENTQAFDPSTRFWEVK